MLGLQLTCFQIVACLQAAEMRLSRGAHVHTNLATDHGGRGLELSIAPPKMMTEASGRQGLPSSKPGAKRLAPD